MISIPNTPFSPSTVLVLLLLMLGLFGASLGIFALHFIYRYLAVSGSSLIKTFDSWKILLWFQLPISSGLAWSITAYTLCSPNREANDYLREGVKRDFGEEIEDFDYRLFYLFKRLGDGEIKFNTDSLVAMAIASVTVVCH